MISGPRDIALTGVPRSGTTLCCRLLGQAPDTVALFEPMDVHRLPAGDHARAVRDVRGFFDQSRRSLLERGSATSQQVDGVVPDNPFESTFGADGARRRQATLGTIAVDKPLTAGFTLVVKHNAAFTALLPELAAAFEVYALVRNPLATLASWNSVDLPVTQGRLPMGERLDPALTLRLDAASGRFERQLVALDWLFSRFAEHLPATRILRYEEIVASRGRSLRETCAIDIAPLPLHSRNASPLYDAVACRGLADRLFDDGGAWRRFYGDDDLRRTLAELERGA